MASRGRRFRCSNASRPSCSRPLLWLEGKKETRVRENELRGCLSVFLRYRDLSLLSPILVPFPVSDLGEHLNVFKGGGMSMLCSCPCRRYDEELRKLQFLDDLRRFFPMFYRWISHFRLQFYIILLLFSVCPPFLFLLSMASMGGRVA